MNQNEVYGSLEFCHKEIRFVLGQFFNNKLNILKTITLTTNAIRDIEIVDKDLLVKDLNRLKNEVKEKLNYNLKDIILMIPDYYTNRYSKRIKVNKKVVDLEKDVLDNIEVDFAEDEILINKTINSFIVNGVHTSKLKDKNIDNFYVDVDIYSGYKKLVYDYLIVVEQANLNILDIFLNSYGVAKEMALIEFSQKNHLLLIDYEQYNTTISYLYNKKIIASTMLNFGYHDLMSTAIRAYKISEDIAKQLILNYGYLNNNGNKGPIFAYSKQSKTNTINNDDLYNLCMPILAEQISEIEEIISPLFEDKQFRLYISGSGASILSLDNIYKDKFNLKTKAYIPEIIGARRPSLVKVLGGLYAYKDNLNYKNFFKEKVKVNIKNVDTNDKELEDTITSRFKELFKKGH